MLNRNEIRALEQLIKNKDKSKLTKYMNNRDAIVYNTLRKEFNEHYKDEVNSGIQNFLIAIAYTLHFNEELHLKNDELQSFMDDLYVSVDMFRKGEYKPEEYTEILKEEYNKLEMVHRSLFLTSIGVQLRS